MKVLVVSGPIDLSVTCSNDAKYLYQLKYNDSLVIFEWGRVEHNQFSVEIKIKQYNKERHILTKLFHGISLHSLLHTFYHETMISLAPHVNTRVLIRISEMFFDIVPAQQYEFELGQLVETIVGDNVKTFRVGHIIKRFYNHSKATNIYQILSSLRSEN